MCGWCERLIVIVRSCAVKQGERRAILLLVWNKRTLPSNRLWAQHVGNCAYYRVLEQCESRSLSRPRREFEFRLAGGRVRKLRCDAGASRFRWYGPRTCGLAGSVGTDRGLVGFPVPCGHEPTNCDLHIGESRGADFGHLLERASCCAADVVTIRANNLFHDD